MRCIRPHTCYTVDAPASQAQRQSWRRAESDSQSLRGPVSRANAEGQRCATVLGANPWTRRPMAAPVRAEGEAAGSCVCGQACGCVDADEECNGTTADETRRAWQRGFWRARLLAPAPALRRRVCWVGLPSALVLTAQERPKTR
jgi:hypothetical protein